MKMHRSVTALALASSLALVSAGCGDKNEAAAGGTTGGTSDAFAVDTSKCPSDATKAISDGADIKIGTVGPLSGPYAVLGGPISEGMKTYFAKVNADGGVDGHKLELVAKDDGYDPTKTLPQVTELLQKDKVFATLGQLGTAPVAAAQPLAEQTCTPQLWVGAGAPQFGDPANHPWTTIGFMSYSTEAQAWADYLKQTKPAAKIAYLQVETEGGDAYASSFEKAATDLGLDIVAHEKTAPDAASVENEMTNLLAAKPDVVILMSVATSCAKAMGALAEGGYRGSTITAYSCASTTIFPMLGAAANGATFLSINKDPEDLPDFLADVEKFGDGVKPSDETLNGYRFADILVKNLRAAAKLKGGLTKANVMDAAWHLDATWFGAWGGSAKLDGEKDAYSLEYGQMLTYDAAKKTYSPAGPPTEREGKTGSYEG